MAGRSTGTTYAIFARRNLFTLIIVHRTIFSFPKNRWWRAHALFGSLDVFVGWWIQQKYVCAYCRMGMERIHRFPILFSVGLILSVQLSIHSNSIFFSEEKVGEIERLTKVSEWEGGECPTQLAIHQNGFYRNGRGHVYTTAETKNGRSMRYFER